MKDKHGETLSDSFDFHRGHSDDCVFSLRLDDSMLRGYSQTVCRPGQVKAQLLRSVVPNLNLTGGGSAIWWKGERCIRK